MFDPTDSALHEGAPGAIRPAGRLRLGILTRNFPPMLGGMAEHAAGLAGALAEQADVTVFAPCWAQAEPGARYRLEAVLHPDADQNTALLSERRVDVWLALSANLAPLAEHSPKPFFLYAHGNDFLRPNPDPSRTLEARLGRTPGLWRARDWLAAPLQEWTLQRRRRQLEPGLQASRAIFVNSRFTAELLARTYPIDGKPVIVSHPGCAERFFAPVSPAAGRDALELLTVCRADRTNRRKNIAGVLQALAQLDGEFPWRYTVIGGGGEQQRLQALAHRLGIADRVQFRGECPAPAVVQAYAQADLFILAAQASPVDVEGFGMVYVEANAAGKPVIGSRTGGSVEAIRPGTTGYLLPDAHPATIAGALRRFAARRDHFAADGIRAFAEQFRWPRVAGELLEALEGHT